MHGIEDILVHGMDRKSQLCAEGCHPAHKLREITLYIRYIHQHYHSEHILKNALCHLDNIYIVLGTDTAHLVENADCIFLMGGGVCEEQLNLIKEKGCYEALLHCHAAVFGVSAGSMNMAKNTVDFFESMEPFPGLGFTNMTVTCHHNPEDTWRYEKTLQMSEDRVVYAMEDMSAFFIKDGKIDIVGKIYRVENRELRLLTEESGDMHEKN